jgi:hypothetical protein
VKNRFQSLPFKRNLQRYNEEEAEFVEGSAPGRQPAGLYELNPVDLNHSVKAPGFSKPLRLKCDVLVSNFAITFNLYRYIAANKLLEKIKKKEKSCKNLKVGAVQVENSVI